MNLTDDTVTGRWSLPFVPREARLARLDETPLGDVVQADGAVLVGPRRRDMLVNRIGSESTRPIARVQ